MRQRLGLTSDAIATAVNEAAAANPRVFDEMIRALGDQDHTEVGRILDQIITNADLDTTRSDA